MSYNYYNCYNSGIMYGVILGAIIIGIIGGIVLYFTFLSKKNEGKFTGFLGWMYNFLSFKKLLLKELLNILYLICACCITLVGIVTLFDSFLAGVLMIILGNVFLRIAYEFTMLIVLICKNVTEINSKLKQ